MKKFGVCAIFSIGVFCVLLLLVPFNAYADTVTLTSINYGPMSGSGAGAGNLYPYGFTVSNTTGIVPLMCLSYENNIDQNEYWTATITPVEGNALYEESAYIFSQMGAYGAGVTQWADWELNDPGDSLLESTIAGLPASDQTAIANLQSNAASWVAANPNSPLYSDYLVYVPDGVGYLPDGTPDGDPQILIGGGAPEPGSFILLGSGLFGLAAFLYFRKRTGLKSV
jgi:hypothetical protein